MYNFTAKLGKSFTSGSGDFDLYLTLFLKSINNDINHVFQNWLIGLFFRTFML